MTFVLYFPERKSERLEDSNRGRWQWTSRLQIWNWFNSEGWKLCHRESLFIQFNNIKNKRAFVETVMCLSLFTVRSLVVLTCNLEKAGDSEEWNWCRSWLCSSFWPVIIKVITHFHFLVQVRAEGCRPTREESLKAKEWEKQGPWNTGQTAVVSLYNNNNEVWSIKRTTNETLLVMCEQMFLCLFQLMDRIYQEIHRDQKQPTNQQWAGLLELMWRQWGIKLRNLIYVWCAETMLLL